MKKKLLYFGCMKEKGHHLFEHDDSYSSDRRGEIIFRDYPVNARVLDYLDGTFAPCDRTEGVYNDCVIPPLRIVAWWDLSVDDRPGSNSVLIAFGYNSAEEIIDDAYKLFPTVMNRQPRPKPCNL